MDKEVLCPNKTTLREYRTNRLGELGYAYEKRTGGQRHQKKPYCTGTPFALNEGIPKRAKAGRWAHTVAGHTHPLYHYKIRIHV
ncbi:Uncharacterized protein BM_BM17440 [Brugia malayi]|uniref:Uncharacterized protein n=1 Tax=Brugia malayi TaxID=6279 RepID=A0A4E9F9P9_BRUMA|nr:Uncharacterized protein BM_BM17440 [Brugia malayi]VIO92763.1 Uncharacterized protein BM_BM17440 [Brugia malayi]